MIFRTIGLVATVVACIRVAFAEPAAVERPLQDAVQVRGQGPCLNKADLTARIARWLGRGTVDARILVEVQGTPGSGPGRLAFTVKREGDILAVRQFDELRGSCDDALSALSLSVSLAIDATVLDRMAVEQKAPDPTPEVGSGPRTLWAEGGMGQGWSPATHAVVGAGLSWGGLSESRRFVGRLLLAFGPESRAAVGPGQGRFTAASVRALGCWDPMTKARLAPHGCLGLAGTWIGAAGDGYADNRAAQALVPAATARVGTDLRLGTSVVAIFALDGTLPFMRPIFDVVAGAGAPVYEQRLPGFAIAAQVGLGFVFR